MNDFGKAPTIFLTRFVYRTLRNSAEAAAADAASAAARGRDDIDLIVMHAM